MEEELRNKIEELELKLETLTKNYENHTHTGADSSKPLTKSIQINGGEYFRSGETAIEGVPYQNNRVLQGSFVVGNDKVVTDGSGNSQITTQHFLDSNDTFTFGLRSPLYTGSDGSVSSGGSTMSQSSYSWATNELANAFVVVFDGDGVTFDCYQIASNTSTTITVTGGTWSFTESGATFVVFMPIYFGSANYPWRRLYTMEGTGAGIRFGLGMTNAGQQDSGLLYMDSAGSLIWRDKNGNSTTIVTGA